MWAYFLGRNQLKWFILFSDSFVRPDPRLSKSLKLDFIHICMFLLKITINSTSLLSSKKEAINFHRRVILTSNLVCSAQFHIFDIKMVEYRKEFENMLSWLILAFQVNFKTHWPWCYFFEVKKSESSPTLWLSSLWQDFLNYAFSEIFNHNFMWHLEIPMCSNSIWLEHRIKDLNTSERPMLNLIYDFYGAIVIKHKASVDGCFK